MIPFIPPNFLIQQANGQVWLTWNIVAGATSYQVQRSVDGVTYTNLAAPALNNYLDKTALINTLYYYQVASVNSSGTSPYTVPQSIIPTLTGQLCLGEARLRAKQKADMQNSNFIDTWEWNFNINQSWLELYDILVTLFEDYYLAPALPITTNGSNSQFPLPDGTNYLDNNGVPAPIFYKLMGVDNSIAVNTNGWLTVNKFQFINRNKYAWNNSVGTVFGTNNLQYRVMDQNIMFIPVPAGNQTLRIWYIPLLKSLLQDTDIIYGVSGWSEYVLVDAAIKAKQKQDLDYSGLSAQKAALMERIEGSAINRDAGQPDRIARTRNALGYAPGMNGGGGMEGWF